MEIGLSWGVIPQTPSSSRSVLLMPPPPYRMVVTGRATGRGQHQLRKRRDRGMRNLGVYAFGARTKKSYPLRKRREVLGSTPSGRGQHQFAEERRDRGMRDLGVYAFGARTGPIRLLRKRRDRGMRGVYAGYPPGSQGRLIYSLWSQHQTQLQPPMSPLISQEDYKSKRVV